MFSDLLQELIPELKVYIRWILSGLIDAISLVLWGWLQYWGGQILDGLKLSSIDTWVFTILQILFAISTLAPIVAFIYKDVAIMVIKTHRYVKSVVVEQTIGAEIGISHIPTLTGQSQLAQTEPILATNSDFSSVEQLSQQFNGDTNEPNRTSS